MYSQQFLQCPASDEKAPLAMTVITGWLGWIGFRAPFSLGFALMHAGCSQKFPALEQEIEDIRLRLMTLACRCRLCYTPCACTRSGGFRKWGVQAMTPAACSRPQNSQDIFLHQHNITRVEALPSHRGGDSAAAAVVVAAAHEAEHEGSRRCTSQWELDAGTAFPGHAGRDSSDDEDDDSAFQAALQKTWDSLDPAVRSRLALIPTLSGAPRIKLIHPILRSMSST